MSDEMKLARIVWALAALTRARLLRTLTRVGRHWEESGRGEIAVDAYLRCIEVDEQCEAFYRNLMLCHQRQGNTTRLRRRCPAPRRS